MAIDQGIRLGDWVAEIEFDISQVTLTTGDLMAHPVEITGATMLNGTSTLLSVVAIDYDDQGGEFDLVFFDENPGAIGVPNVAVAMSDAQAEMVCGHVSITDEYSDVGAQQIATLKGLGVAMHPVNGTSLWVAPISRESQITYASGLMTVKLGLLRS